MKTDDDLRRELRAALDRRLSGVSERPDSQERLLRLAKGEEKIVKKKLSVGAVLVLALLVATMAAALATGGFGLLDYRQEDAENRAFVDNITTVGQTFENEYLSISVNQAAFNGTTVTFTMDIVPKDVGDPVFVIPAITATVDGQTLQAQVVGATGNYTDSGFWVPGMDPRVEESTQYGVEATLMGRLGSDRTFELPQGDVTWALSFEILHPNWPISYVTLTLPTDDSDEVLTDEMDERYDHLFAEAYAAKQILLAPDGSLFTYVAMMPQPDGIPGGEKGQEELQKVLEQSDAFTIAARPVITFTTSGVKYQTGAQAQSYPLADGWTAEVRELNVTYDRIDYALTLRREAGDGKNAAQSFLENAEEWSFAILADGAVTTPYGRSAGAVEEDGTVHVSGTVALSGPTTRVTFVPCRVAETVLGEPAADGYVPVYDTEHMTYANQAPYTKEQETLQFSIDVK